MEKHRSHIIKIIIGVTALLYLAGLLWASVIHGSSDVWSEASFLTYASEFTNFIPLKSFFGLMTNPGAQTVPVILQTFVVIFVALIPFGILFFLAFPAKNVGHCALAAAVLLLVINAAKLFSRRGSFDIDDIIVGTLAAVLAFLVTKFIGGRFCPAT